MRKITLLVVVLALAAAACGDDDATSTTGSDSTAATTTSAATTTLGDVTTTTAVDETAARVAAASELAGTYSGEWTNTTFGSSGDVDLSLTVDAATATAEFTLDLGGSVFGGGDPDPVVAQIDLSSDGPYAGTSDLFDDYTVDIDGGVLTFTAPDISALTGMMMVVTGPIDPAGFDLEYTITHPAGTVFAVGKMTLAPRR